MRAARSFAVLIAVTLFYLTSLIPGRALADRGADTGTVVTNSTVRPPRDALPQTAPAYPTTRRMDLTETQFGVSVADPYRWLEGDARLDAEVQAWVSAQNRATQSYLSALPGREILRTRISALYADERSGTPRKAGGRYFFTRNSGGQNFSPLYVLEGDGKPARLLLDPNDFSADGTVGIAEWQPSPDGRHVLYAVQDGGSDWRVLRVVNVESGETLDDRAEWVRYSNLAWRNDGAGFYYSRFKVPEPGANTRFEDQQLWYHALGTPQSTDALIHATPGRPRLLHRARVTDDGRWLIISSTVGTDPRGEITLLSLSQPGAQPVRLVRTMNREWQFVGNVGDRLFFRTTRGAAQGRLVTFDATRPNLAPAELVAERAQMLVGGAMIGSRIVLAYATEGRVVAELVDLEGQPRGDVPLPGLGSAAGFSGRAGDPETFFSFSNFTTPPTIYRYNVDTGETSIFARSALGIDPANYVTEQISYPSKDGTLIPMSIIRRRDLALSGKPAPTLLYGYGGFNVSQTPGFSPTRFAWIEQGGVLAIASLRGGGEFGKAWHDAGRLLSKQNVFDDFIAAAEFLKARGYAGPGQLAIEGRSNGGLLVGAVVNQRPDLFAAALPAVGVMDMLRFDRFTAGSFWVDDYGRPDRKADFRNLLSYSPYHNIREGLPYPAILVTTADEDDRVVPSHSFKYAAALQHADLGTKPRLIRIDTRAGHGSGKPIDKLIDEYADAYSFAAYWTGLTLKAK